jgi:hypothetical protein
MATLRASSIHNCWNCGGPGIGYSGSSYICPKCQVTWNPFVADPPPLGKQIAFWGVIVDTVDFTKPDAPLCP